MSEFLLKNQANLLWFGLIVAILILLALASVILWRRFKPTDKEFRFDLQTKQVGRWNIRYHASGRGPNLVLIHGIGADLFCWRRVIPLLNKKFRVIALDLPGFGGSSKFGDEAYGLDDQVERLQRFLTVLHVQRAFLVGNSMGGNVALWYARTYPDRIERIAVIAPAVSPKLVPLDLQKLAWLSKPAAKLVNRTALNLAHRLTVAKQDRVNRERVEETYKTYANNPDAVASFLRATAAIRDDRLPDGLAELRVPALLLRGGRDRIVPQLVIDKLERILPEVESYLHESGGHHLQEDEPEWVTERLVAFFLS